MVARKKGANEASGVPPLDPVSPLEKKYYEQGALNACRRYTALYAEIVLELVDLIVAA